jgi:CRP/FNR family cyclic AMP-dependent transcriptional regulator
MTFPRGSAAAVANPGTKPGRSWSGRLTCGCVAELPAVGSFLGSLAADERTALGQIGHARSYRRGERMILEGDQNDTTYLVLEGRVRVFTGTPEGNEVTLCVRGPGDLIGEMGALDPGGRRSANVIALEPVRCRVIAARELQAFLEAHPRSTLALLRLVIGRLRGADRRRTEFGPYDATRRLARVLIEAADEAAAGAPAHGGRRDGSAAGVQLGLALSQHELSGLIGASRESVARGMAELRRRGLVTTGRRSVTILDADGLRSFAG